MENKQTVHGNKAKPKKLKCQELVPVDIPPPLPKLRENLILNQRQHQRQRQRVSSGAGTKSKTSTTSSTPTTPQLEFQSNFVSPVTENVDNENGGAINDIFQWIKEQGSSHAQQQQFTCNLRNINIFIRLSRIFSKRIINSHKLSIINNIYTFTNQSLSNGTINATTSQPSPQKITNLYD
ncbi:unnamed protein product [Hermetia illucens]|uniref:Uncharacterized protein n=1 Tax=Hermetia illucens TaxID=343691 RepID=A0A7R8URK2_HERIL|nr:unnamed protein product [Hermetia illucens]